MPQVLAPIIAAAVPALGATAVAGVTYATIIANVAFAGAMIGAQYLFRQQAKTPTREPLKQTIKQSSAPRFRAYGRVRTGGVAYFWDAAGPIFCMGLAIGSGRIAQVRGLYIDGKETSWSAETGAITSGPLAGYASVYFSLGALNVIPGPIIATFFPSIWGADHLLKGIPYMEMSISRPSEKAMQKVLPSGVPQAIRVEYDGAMVWDCRSGSSSAPSSSLEWHNAAWTWSDNPALCILDYLRHPDGARLPLEWIDVESFSVAADYCDALVTTNAAGVTEKRYRLSGIYSFDEEARATLARMLATCDGELYLTNDGQYAIRLGQYRAPSVTLNEECIRELALEQGNGRLAGYTTVRTKFLDPLQDYQLVEGPTVEDAAAVAAYGVQIVDEIALDMVPSATQAHRLGRRRMLKGNARNRITIATDARGLLAIGEPSVGVAFRAGAFSVNTTFEVRDLKASQELSTVTMDLQQAVAAYYDEGYPAVDVTPIVTPAPAVAIETPTGLTAAVERGVTAMGETLRLVAAVTAPIDGSLAALFEYRPGGAGEWASMSSTGDASAAVVGVLDNTVYEVRARFVDPSGRSGDDAGPVDASLASVNWLAETRAAIARMTVRPTDLRGETIDAMIRALVAAGVWNKLDALYLLAAHDAQAARINLVRAEWSLTQVGSVDFEIDGGFAGDGSTGYHATGFNPSATTGALFARDDAHMGLWSLTDGVSAAHDMGGGNASLAMLATASAAQTRGNGGASSGSATSGLGHFAWSRASSASYARYRDGAAHSTVTQTSAAAADYAFRVGGYAGSTPQFSARRIAAAHFGRALTATESTALHGALHDYLAAVGAV